MQLKLLCKTVIKIQIHIDTLFSPVDFIFSGTISFLFQFVNTFWTTLLNFRQFSIKRRLTHHPQTFCSPAPPPQSDESATFDNPHYCSAASVLRFPHMCTSKNPFLPCFALWVKFLFSHSARMCGVSKSIFTTRNLVALQDLTSSSRPFDFLHWALRLCNPRRWPAPLKNGWLHFSLQRVPAWRTESSAVQE